MTITLDLWIAATGIVLILAVGVAIYERGQRKGLEAAEELYRPLFEALEARVEAERKDAKEK
jgi:hypothetical protein